MNSHGGARKGAGRPQTPIDTRRLLVLKEQGVSMKAIAERFDVKEHIIKYALDKMRKSK